MAETDPRTIRVVSDGTGPGTVVLFNDEPLPHVIGVDLRLRPGVANEARLELLNVGGDVAANVVELREQVVKTKADSQIRIVTGDPVRRWWRLRSWWRFESWRGIGPSHWDVTVVSEGWGPPMPACSFRAEEIRE